VLGLRIGRNECVEISMQATNITGGERALA